MQRLRATFVNRGLGPAQEPTPASMLASWRGELELLNSPSCNLEEGVSGRGKRKRHSPARFLDLRWSLRTSRSSWRKPRRFRIKKCSAFRPSELPSATSHRRRELPACPATRPIPLVTIIQAHENVGSHLRRHVAWQSNSADSSRRTRVFDGPTDPVPTDWVGNGTQTRA